MTTYDFILRNGMIYDGTGQAPYPADLAIQGERLMALGTLSQAHGKTELDANGLAIAPGFINMLSWAVESLIHDGRSQSDIRQGVTLEVMGEGTSMGPLNEAMKANWRGILSNSDLYYDIDWTTLDDYLRSLVKRGVACNVASFVGTGTLRRHAMGLEQRPPTPKELDAMRQLVRTAMQDGAVGLSAALIYPPAAYADTDEIIALAEVVAEYDGLYISHLRSEGAAFLEALDELFKISDRAGVRAEIYHLKAAGKRNWDKMDEAIRRIEAKRAAGKPITADMYSYTAGGTGLEACIPPWAHSGGRAALQTRLQDSAEREHIRQAMLTPTTEWENMFLGASPENIRLVAFSNPALRPLAGKTLAQVAIERGTSPDHTLLDLVTEDTGHIFAAYFMMSDANVERQLALPWVSLCSDAESLACEGLFLKSKPHPRAYGSFARFMGYYVRERSVTTLADAIRRMTHFPAQNLGLAQRGLLAEGYYADVVVFDPHTIQDHATYEQPHQYATGVQHVFVNGQHVLKGGKHTGALPGQVVRPGRANALSHPR